MKLKQVSGESSQKAKAAPTVAFCYLNGAIRFNKATVELLGLKKGDNLAFFQDEDNPTAWYFTKSTNRGSIQLKAQGTMLYNYSASIARVLLKSRGITQESARFYINEVKVEGKYWEILTEKLK